MNPLISVIIPTAGLRPSLLIRAVESALAGFASGEVEVIVVPNGSELRWRDAIASIADYPNVNILPVDKASANAARNHGLANAKGVLVRFLDDDDYLIPAVAARQCYELFASAAEVSSYAIRIEDESGKHWQTLKQPEINDFASAQLGARRLQLPLAHVYKRALISPLLWDERYAVSEDTAWLHTVACQKDIQWIKSDEVVGVWYQHAGPRLSYAYAAHEPNRITANSIFDSIEVLDKQGRFTEERRNAAAEGLWQCIHRGFYMRPCYWHKIAKKTLTIAPKSRPGIGIYHRPLFIVLSPILLQWIMLPKRVLNHFARMTIGIFSGWDYVRKL